MFGVATFANLPFATLPSGGNYYSVTIYEAVRVNSAQVGGALLYADISEPIDSVVGNEDGFGLLYADISEQILVADNYLNGVAFYAAILEAIIADAEQAAIGEYNGLVTEEIGVNSGQDCIATLHVLEVESLYVNDSNLGAAWVRIDDSETANWTLIDNRQ